MTNYSSSIDSSINGGTAISSAPQLNTINNLNTYIDNNVLKLKNQNINPPSSTLYLYNPNYNMTNTISTVVWSILATSIVYYVFIKL